MPRPHKPQYHAPRRCWKAAIGGRTRFFARGVLPTDRPQVAPGIPERAWLEMTALLKAEAADVAPAAGMTVEGLCQSYATWAEARAAEGKLDGQHARNKALHLAKLADRFGTRPAA